MWDEKYEDDSTESFGKRMYAKAKREENTEVWGVIVVFSLMAVVICAIVVGI